MKHHRWFLLVVVIVDFLVGVVVLLGLKWLLLLLVELKVVDLLVGVVQWYFLLVGVVGLLLLGLVLLEGVDLLAFQKHLNYRLAFLLGQSC